MLKKEYHLSTYFLFSVPIIFLFLIFLHCCILKTFTFFCTSMTGFSTLIIFWLYCGFLKFYLKFFKLILERERRGGERSINLLFHLRVHWLILLCALRGEWTCDLGVSGWGPNELSQPARALSWILIVSWILLCLWVLRSLEEILKCSKVQVTIQDPLYSPLFPLSPGPSSHSTWVQTQARPPSR